jgi:hypothetical protein
MQKKERLILKGTSVTQRAVVPPADLDNLFKKLVVPFFDEFPGFIPLDSSPDLQELFHWATAIVASYSFELGDEGLHVCFS